jgi:DNA-binding NtrC family response regulator
MNAQGYSRPVILCADHKETETQRELFRRVLETAGYTVLSARSAHKALEIFRQRRVDLVLTEHIPPATADSPTLAASMKRLKPYVPVAIYSADWVESPEDMRFADMFITKLVSIDELLRTIVKLLDKVAPFRPAA